MKRLRRFLLLLAALFLLDLAIGYFLGRRCDGNCPVHQRRYR